jgi:hypothetical protein
MVWNVISNNDIIITATEPSNVKISQTTNLLEHPNIHVQTSTVIPMISAKKFLNRLSTDDQNAIKQEAIKQYAAGYTHLWHWWKKIESGRGLIIPSHDNTKAVIQILGNNNILSTETITMAFTV